MTYEDIEMSIIENKTKKELKKAGGKRYIIFNAKYKCKNSNVLVINHDTVQDYSPDIKEVKGISNGITIVESLPSGKIKITNVQVLNLEGEVSSSLLKKILDKHFDSIVMVKEEMEKENEEEDPLEK